MNNGFNNNNEYAELPLFVSFVEDNLNIIALVSTDSNISYFKKPIDKCKNSFVVFMKGKTSCAREKQQERRAH